MFTFLLDQYKAGAKRLYALRFAGVCISLFLLVLITGFALTVPTFATLNIKRNAALLIKNSAAEAAKNEAGSVEAEVQGLKAKIAIIKETSSDIPLTSVLDHVLAKRSPGISIQSIQLRRGGEPGAISLGGIASTRDELVAFSKELQKDKMFTGVNLPVESLSKSKNIPFTIIIESKF